MINNKNYTRDQLKEILEDELFQNLLFHTANRNCYYNLNKACSKSKLTDKDFEWLDRGIRYIGNNNLRPSEYFVLVAIYYVKDELDKSIENLEKFLEVYDKPIENNLTDLLMEYAFRSADRCSYFEEKGLIYYTALSLYNKEIYDEAIPIFEKVLQLDFEKDKEWTSLYFLILSHLLTNQFDKAMEYFNQILSLYPDNLSVYGLIGGHYYKNKDYEKAIEYYQVQSNYYNQLLNEEENKYKLGYNGLILCYLETGKIDKIIKELEQFLLSEPNNSSLLSCIANCYYLKKDYDKVFEIIDKALSIDPYNYQSLSLLANNYYKKESYKRAIYYYKEAIRIEYNRKSSIQDLGITYIKIKDFDQAKRIFQFVLSIWSKEGLDYFILGKIYEHLGQNDLASENFEKASLFKSYFFPNYEEYLLEEGVF